MFNKKPNRIFAKKVNKKFSYMKWNQKLSYFRTKIKVK